MFKHENMEPSCDLPPGFRFHPTDEELINYYLAKKSSNSNFSVRAIIDVDINQCEPWDFRGKEKSGEKEWYFFTLRDRKYPTGTRTNRATEAGYWKATGKDREIVNSTSGCIVGMKKTLVFYRGRAPKGVKTNWIMHEYRLEGANSCMPQFAKDVVNKAEWVVCRIFQKKTGCKNASHKGSTQVNLVSMLEGQDVFPPFHESSNKTSAKDGEGDAESIVKEDPVSCFPKESYRFPFPSKIREYNDSAPWQRIETSSMDLDSASLVCGSNDSSCLDQKHTGILREDNASSSSGGFLKLFKAPTQQGSEPIYLAKCKVEQSADSPEIFQNGYKSAWPTLQESTPYEDSQQLIEVKYPSISPLMETFCDGDSHGLYRSELPSTEDFDCLLAN